MKQEKAKIKIFFDDVLNLSVLLTWLCCNFKVGILTSEGWIYIYM